VKVFVVIWIGSDGEAEFYGAWSTREAAESVAKVVVNRGDDWGGHGVRVIEANIDEAVKVDLF
jgi:ribulose-5-phosphate 4-epimerase/fuculose-1-phosphate aldolase